MKAAVRRNYGSSTQIRIENIQKPSINENEILVKVFATTVNRTDCANLTARPFIMRFVLGLMRPRKIILGTDFAGKIIALGKNVRSFKIGDKVYGFKDTGAQSQAEYIKETEAHLYPIPENIDYKQAAASLEGAHYAYTFIHKVSIQPGQKVLLNGATGAIGSALLQFLKQYDIHITATCSTKNIELIKSLGAHHIYDYTREDFTRSTNKYDYIFDSVGKTTFGKCKPLLNKNGVYISSELGPYCQNLLFSVITSTGKGKKVVFPVPFSTQKTIPYISKLLKEEIFKPVIDREFSLENTALAYDYVLKGEKVGNVILGIDDHNRIPKST